VWLALEIVVPIVVGVVAYYGLMRRRLPSADARRATVRFALLWVPAAIAIIVVASVIVDE
jgi:putative effector of murein hydrolase LrgA (UPF0299 family)